MDTAVKFPTTPKAVKATPLKLNKRMRVEHAFEVIVRSCIDQIHANHGGVARFGAMESLHQMRVGLRRLRAALALFEATLPGPPGIAGELDWLMDQLSAARDWDVLLASTLPQVQKAMPDAQVLDDVRQAAQGKLQLAYAQAGNAVGSPRYQELMRTLEQWVAARGWREALTTKRRARLKMRARDLARAILEQEQQRLLKRGAKLQGASAEQRHRVRIAAKRARYAAEFFTSLYPKRQVRPYVAALAALQEHLGSMNDGAVADRLVRALADADAGVREGAALLRGYLSASGKQGLPLVRKAWKTLAPLEPPH